MRRRLFSALWALCLLAGLMPARAAAQTTTLAMRLGSPWCVVGDEFLLIDDKSRAVVPVLEQETTLVPVRRILEAFGGRADYVPATNGVVCTLRGRQVELTLGSTAALVDGRAVELEVPARAQHQRTFVPLRFVAESLGLSVGYEAKSQIVVLSDGALNKNGLDRLEPVQVLAGRTNGEGDPVSLKSGRWDLPSGALSANVVTVNMGDLRVSVKAVLPEGRLNTTRPFQTICADGGAVVVMNANFFDAQGEDKDPVGNLICDGELLYLDSGISSLGFTVDNQMRYGRPAVYVRVKSGDREWSAYSVNTLEQTTGGSVLYTPARGASVPVTCAGYAMTVADGMVKSYDQARSGHDLTIPADGFVLYMGKDFTLTSYFKAPKVGRKAAMEPYLSREDGEGFTLSGVTDLVSGSPRLVRNGKAANAQDDGFTDSRFTTLSTARSAAGTTEDGQLLLVTAPSATVAQMGELMLELGCRDALNLDGGASVGLWYQGRTISKPGRELAATIQVFVEQS